MKKRYLFTAAALGALLLTLGLPLALRSQAPGNSNTAAAVRVTTVGLGTSGTPAGTVQSVQGPVAEGGTNTGAPVPIGIHSPTGIRWVASANNLADGDGGTRLPAVAAWGYDGANYANLRILSPTNLTAATSTGIALMAKAARWSVTSTPAAGSQASASKAAGGGTVRHVVDTICFSASATTAPTATGLVVNLRDGATGAGTVLWSHRFVATATVGTHQAPFCVTDLNLIGTANTAMTLEFSAALANEFQDVNLSGYSVP